MNISIFFGEHFETSQAYNIGGAGQANPPTNYLKRNSLVCYCPKEYLSASGQFEKKLFEYLTKY